MSRVDSLVTEYMDVWSAAVERKAGVGRGSRKKVSLHGVKKLRELILELAVRGKLVEQDEGDESAASLLALIQEEKERAVKQGWHNKKGGSLDIAKRDANLPKSWTTVKMGNITNYGFTDKKENTQVAGNTWILELEDIEKVTSRLHQKIRHTDRQFKSTKNVFKAGDILYGKLRPYLDKVIIADEDGLCTTEILPFRPFGPTLNSYLRLTMKTPNFIQYANNSTHGMSLPRIGTDKVRNATIPLPPLAEQHRIVAKVNELMTLCDKLEKHSEDSLAAHDTLVTTLLDTLTQSDLAEELTQNRNRLAQHFDTLFSTPQSIEYLKQTILQLAVMGKLVPQDPEDESASELLRKIGDEKKCLIKNKKIKNNSVAQNTITKKHPMTLPNGWSLTSLSQIGTFASGKTPSKMKKEF